MYSPTSGTASSVCRGRGSNAGVVGQVQFSMGQQSILQYAGACAGLQGRRRDMQPPPPSAARHTHLGERVCARGEHRSCNGGSNHHKPAGMGSASAVRSQELQRQTPRSAALRQCSTTCLLEPCRWKPGRLLPTKPAPASMGPPAHRHWLNIISLVTRPSWPSITWMTGTCRGGGQRQGWVVGVGAVQWCSAQLGWLLGTGAGSPGRHDRGACAHARRCDPPTSLPDCSCTRLWRCRLAPPPTWKARPVDSMSTSTNSKYWSMDHRLSTWQGRGAGQGTHVGASRHVEICHMDGDGGAHHSTADRQRWMWREQQRRE